MILGGGKSRRASRTQRIREKYLRFLGREVERRGIMYYLPGVSFRGIKEEQEEADEEQERSMLLAEAQPLA